MNHSFDLEIRDWLARYVEGEITLTEFRDWFEPATWGIEFTGGRSAEQLSYAVELAVAEFTNGHRTEVELKDVLRPEAVTYSTGFPGPLTGTSATASRPTVGISHAAVLVS